jgi:type IV pilus assembly protein PilV
MSAQPIKFISKSPMRVQQAGFSMLEVMVSIVIFSFGMLALAGLQLSAFKYQSGAAARSNVAALSSSIAERVRLNIAGAQAGNYSYNTKYETAKAEALTAAACGVACSPQQIAENDIAAWLDEAQAALPGGAVSLSGTAADGFTATVMWFDKEMANAGSDPVTYEKSETCDADFKGTDARNCCPASAAVPAGVRCINTYFLP